MRSKYGFVVGMASLLLAVSMAQAQLNHPPATPTVTEPAFDGRIVNPADVHMECSAFSDPDPGDTHACTDWEIWTVDPQERVWSALCVGTVPDLFHIHLGGGTFENSYAGRSVLEFDTAYRLRVRHKDSSGDPATEWSDYGVRLFQTAPATEIPPLIMDDVLDSAPPRWVATNGVNIILPGATPAPSVRVESGAGDGLVEIRGLDGVSNRLINFPPLGAHVPVRIVVSAGGLPGPLTLSETNLSFTDHSSLLHTVYLPAVVLPPGAQAFFWVSVSGATYVAQPGQTDPDFSQIARSAPVPFAVRQPGYVVEQVAGGFHLPVNIAFVPNPGNLPESPLFYVTELHGAIKLVKRNGAVSDYATNLLNFVPSTKILGDAQQGVTGVVVDPANGDLIVAMLFDVAPPIGPHAPKIVRMHSTDGGLTASTITTILAMPSELQSYSHQISNLTISPDGDLFVHMGDGFYTETALDLDSARGKILRMKLNGSAPSDNPFYNAADGISARDYVYALGFRNPFGGGWRQSDQQHYEVENGPSIDRFAKVVRGRNYLWDGTDESMFNWALYNWPVPHAATNIVFINPGTFNASSFPPDKVDHAFVAESGPTAATGPNYFGKRIAEFVLTPGGDLAAGPFSLIEYDGSGRGTVVALAAGPDGLYFSDFFKDYGEPLDRGSNILRVRYVGEAGFAADVRSGPLPLTVHFSDASSVLAPSSWQWDFGDGTTSTQRNPVHTYGAAGAYQVRLSVTGTGGLVSTDSPCFIRAGDLPHIAVLGATPPGSADDSLAAHLRSRGAVVDVYGCDAPTRPSGAELAQTTDLVIITTTTAPDSRSAEFRDLAVPLIIWDPRLLGYNRIALAGLGITSASETSISVVDRRHPLTLPLALSDLSVYQTAGPMNFAGGGINAAVRVLATRVGGPTLPAVLAADRGADLLDNVPAPAPRAFLFFSATGWLAATPAAIGILDRTVDWATQLEPVSITAHPLDAVVAAQRTAAFSVTADGSAPITYRWRRDGVPLNDDGRVTGVTTPTLTISNLSLADSGYYDALMANGCASATSNAAVLTVTPACPCDWDGVDGLNSQDFFEFLTDFFAGHADINHSGDTDSQDFFDFLTCFFGECH